LNLGKISAHTIKQAAAVCGAIGDSRQGLDVRFDVGERPRIESEELRGNGQNALDRFGVEGNRADDQCWAKACDFLDRLVTPAIT
jgi:hypothetical protein